MVFEFCMKSTKAFTSFLADEGEKPNFIRKTLVNLLIQTGRTAPRGRPSFLYSTLAVLGNI
jgi:hypothetical protein